LKQIRTFIVISTMLQKFHILLIITFLGCLTVPVNSYACGTKSKKAEKSCCLKDSSDKSNKKDCCNNHKNTQQKEDNSCGGNCDNSKCSCPPTLTSLVLSNYLVRVDIITFRTSEKVKSYYNETYHSFGFGYIWTPPNIG
jgi:hypothetical protein